ncbi:MAG TPA: hypothetical protein VK856_05925 [Anaerolineaceae bacterium]|nr:hypothetical protein [Anaerolineaceae bacterium]
MNIYFLTLLFITQTIFGQIPKVAHNDSVWQQLEIKNFEMSEYFEHYLYEDFIFFFEKNLINDHKEFFHIVDWNLDGIDDLIYSGPGSTDSKQTIIYEGRDGKLIKKLDVFGEIINFTLTGIGSPYGFVMYHTPFDPPDILRNIETYIPICADSGYSFKLDSKICFIEFTNFPDVFNIQKPFVVANNGYRLRMQPLIDDETVFFHFGKGNTIAIYESGSRGIALAEKTDHTGRTWWFVLMLNNLPFRSDYFDNIGNPANEFFCYGWMSSRFLITE